MTRLRFVLKDESQADDAYMKNIPGVMGVMKKVGNIKSSWGMMSLLILKSYKK